MASSRSFRRCRFFSSNAEVSTASPLPPPPLLPPWLMSFSFSALISSLSLLIWLDCSFLIALTLMAFALLAYFKVDNVSSKLHAAGDRAANIAVILLPPNDSCSTRVNLLLRYGIKAPLPLEASTRALITLPSADKDLLILAPSLRTVPVAPVLLTRSLPARSTRFTLAKTFLLSSSTSFWCRLMIKTLWEREESAFICVEATVRLRIP
mmetsp:Transcript_56370/g.98995  ORF Transcript_56370/g.98995 Transcript_56370/m.98995 type:complete len:209 (+) Transcript_56370:2416-3042(+)